ncbi:MAG TPA: prolyl oligopeptidase family serine peptidase [Tepidisphaeraceae bacterium]|jgi:acetyl esterase/lipase|nr:prolyl oligopeptidase family serine peptidase [Tepidisphaeraceae bacterium]
MSKLRASLLVVFIFLFIATPSFAQERIHDVIYGRKFGMALTMDILKPAKPNGIGVVVMLSGGFSSDIKFIDGFGLDNFKAFTNRGDTVFFVCHGSQPKFIVAEIVPDIHRAIRFIRTNAKDYNVDPNRLGIMGASSGGYLSVMIGASGKTGDPSAKDPIDRASSQVQAVACFFPPTDLVDYGQPGRLFNQFEPVKFVWHTIPVADKPREEQIKILRELSPITHISKDTAPTFIITGDNDALVPHEQSVRFIQKLEELKIPAKIDIRSGAGHGWANMGKDYELLADWFDKYCTPAR